jgi:hypothetical protein
MMERDPPRVARPRPASASVSESDSASGRWRGHSRRGGRPRRRITTAHDCLRAGARTRFELESYDRRAAVRHGKQTLVQEMPLHTAFAVRKGRVGVGCSAACGLLAPRGRSGASPRDPPGGPASASEAPFPTRSSLCRGTIARFCFGCFGCRRGLTPARHPV